jgi:hypothetical protein
MSEEPEEIESIDDAVRESNQEEPTAIELGVLTGAILDYYETTGEQPLDSGEEWKRLKPEEHMPKTVSIPMDLDEEIKKAFMAQIKKFQ